MKIDWKKILSLLFIYIFSFALVVIAEYMQVCSMYEVIRFVFEKAGVVIFCTTALFFFVMSLVNLTGSVLAGTAIGGVTTYVISCIEYYKYAVSGSHLVVADIGFLFNVGEISGFAEMQPEAHVFRAGAALLLLIVLMAFVKSPLMKMHVRNMAMGVACFLLMIALVSPTGATFMAYEILQFDTQPALTTMGMNERFENDGFLGFLSQNATEFIDSEIDAPDGYSEGYMNALLHGQALIDEEEKPNIVIITSESFADLRTLGENDSFSEVYADFDRAAELGVVGECVLPTFGGYTVRSEFELMFGLPSMSMSNVAAPHKLLDEDEDQNTLVRNLKNSGYATTYIHAFNGSFYDREIVYPKYGFDNMVFEDSYAGLKEEYHGYISDESSMEQIKRCLLEEEKPQFVFAMTMQNHQPYVEEGGSIENELSYYLDGVKETSKSLYEFLLWVEAFDEDTVILFVGDHYPFFTPQGGVYESFNVNEDNAERLYTQKYIIYSNYDRISLSEEKISLFYLPHVLFDRVGVARTAFTMTMLDEMQKSPVYSIANYKGERNLRLDSITYDRALGECYIK